MSESYRMHWLSPTRFDIHLNEPMSVHTSFRIGGPADVWICVRDFMELADILNHCRHDRLPYTITGHGYNTLVRDGGIEGVVLQLVGEPFKRIQRVPEGLRVGAGVRLQTLVGECMRRNLTGCEFLVAIPGSVGGAVRMNAGTRDETISQRVLEVTALDSDGRIHILSREDIPFGYRSSGLKDFIVLEVRLNLGAASHDYVRQQVVQNFLRKKRTQDLITPSAGSIFKNSADGLVPSARLIEMSGLKGRRLGGAQVSPVHANFIVNVNDAKAHDVESLIELVAEKVRRDHGVELELELEVVGRKKRRRF